jgi:lipopolysaccharide biosynthesis regulator YciM
VPVSYYFLTIKPIPKIKTTSIVKIKEKDKKNFSNEKIMKELKVIDSYLIKNRVEMAEIGLGKLIKKYGKKSIISLYLSDIYIRKKEYMAAIREIRNVKFKKELRNKIFLFKAKIEYGFKNYSDSLKFLKKINKQEKDFYTIEGIKLKKIIEKEIKLINKKMIISVNKSLKKYYELINNNRMDETLKIFHDKKVFNKNNRNLRIIYSKSKKILITPISIDVNIKYKRGSSRVTATILEMTHILGKGNIPYFYLEYKLVNFNIDDKPLITDIEIIKKIDKKSVSKNRKFIELSIINSNNKINLEEIMERLEKIYAKSKDNGYILFSLVEIYSSIGKSDEIIDLLENKIEKIKLNPSFKFGDNLIYSQLYDFLGAAFFDKDDDLKYIKYLKKGLSLNKKNGKIIIQLMRNELNMKNIDNYKKYYSLLMVTEPDYPDFDKTFFPVLYSEIIKIKKMISEENFRDSMEILTRLKQKSSNYWRISDCMGDVFYKLERYNQAITMYEAALRSNPYNSEIMRKIALSFFYNEEFEDGENYIKKAVTFGSGKKIRKALKLIMKKGVK